MKISTLTERINEIIGKDSGGEVSRKMRPYGVDVTYQAVHKWMNGGNLTEENITALCAAYHVSEAWLRYGEGEKRILTPGQEATIDLFGALPAENVQSALDFIEFQLNRPEGPSALEKKAYRDMISRIRADMEAKNETME